MASFDPDAPTDAALLPILEELQGREPIFHRPELSTGAEDLERQMAPDFFEVGASGHRYSRSHVQNDRSLAKTEAGRRAHRDIPTP